MLLPDQAPLGAPIWVELFSSDPAKSHAFYSQLFAWNVLEMGPDYGNYFNFLKGDQMIAGGMMNQPESGMPDAWSVYLKTADAAATQEAVAAHGGMVIVPTMDVMDLGRMLVTVDVGGAAIGAWQPGTHRGFQAVGEASAPVWFELHTREYDRCLEYYRDVFHWDVDTMDPTPDFRYSTLKDGEGDDWSAGMMDVSGLIPDEINAQWLVYFGSDDVDASVAKAEELGGTVLEPATDTPYGRMATLADPTGAVFKIMKGNL